MNKNLTIIILTYNSQNIIKDCLSKINFDKYKVVVVDNDSKDDTVRVVKENFAVDKLYNLPTNIGFGNANNVALEDVDTDYALVLNPDAVIEEEDIEKVLKVLEDDEKAALAGPVILEDQEKYQARVKFMCDNHGPYQENQDSYYVRFLVGCTLFFKMSVMREIGFFDKNIFLFYEENEICYRVMKAGYHPIVVKDSKALHLKEASSTRNARLVYLRNWHLVWSKAYWKSLEKGLVKAKFSCIRNIIFGVFSFIQAMMIFDKKNIVIYKSTISASFAFILGLKPFKKDGTPRLN